MSSQGFYKECKSLADQSSKASIYLLFIDAGTTCAADFKLTTCPETIHSSLPHDIFYTLKISTLDFFIRF